MTVVIVFDVMTPQTRLLAVGGALEALVSSLPGRL
jgi:hypothetical protein